MPLRTVIEEESAAERSAGLSSQSSRPLNQLAHQCGWIEWRVPPKGTTLQRACPWLLPDEHLTLVQKRDGRRQSVPRAAIASGLPAVWMSIAM